MISSEEQQENHLDIGFVKRQGKSQHSIDYCTAVPINLFRAHSRYIRHGVSIYKFMGIYMEDLILDIIH